jgi:hypothetical protein
MQNKAKIVSNAVKIAANMLRQRRSNMPSPMLKPLKKELMLSPTEPVKTTKVFFKVSIRALQQKNCFYIEKKQKKNELTSQTLESLQSSFSTPNIIDRIEVAKYDLWDLTNAKACLQSSKSFNEFYIN